MSGADGVDFKTALRFAMRGGTAAHLAAWNGVLAPREEVVEVDTGKRKIGDGITAYNALPYFREADLARVFEFPKPTTTRTVTVTHNKGRDPVAWEFLETSTGRYYTCSATVMVTGVSVSVHVDLDLVGKILLVF